MSLARLIAASCLSLVAALPASAGTVVEYYHKDLDHYFVTGLATEIQALDSGRFVGWARTGLSFETFAPGDSRLANSAPVCRFLGNPARGLTSHFYSAFAEECATVKSKWPDEWKLETDELYRVHLVSPTTGQCPAGTKPVYRLWNKRADANHRYTTEAAVVDSMVVKGYVMEGTGSPQRPVAFCAADTLPAPPAAGSPVCTITSGTPFPVVGTPVTLTASCTNAPTTFAWSNCTPSGSTCVATAASVGRLAYAVVASNAVGPGAPARIELDWQLAASGAPACTVVASTATPQLGGTLTLTANCSQTPTQFQWMGCSALLVDACNPLSECSSASGTCRPIATQAGPVFYAVIARNGAGAAPKTGIAVAWQGSAGGGGTTPPPTANTPICTIDASPPSPSVNTSLTLTANCTNNPTSYIWAGCTSTGATCVTTEPAAASRLYAVSGRNAAGVGNTAQVTVAWQQPPTSPPSCTVTANNPAPVIGTNVTLTASCTQSPTGFQWTNCNSSTSTCTASSAAVGQVAYSVIASNGLGSGQSASTTVNWTDAPPPGADFCSQYPGTVRHTFSYGGSNNVATRTLGGWPATSVLVGKFTTPSTPLDRVPGMVSLVEYDGPPTSRWMTLSTSACDFREADPSGQRGPLAVAIGQTPSIAAIVSTGGTAPGIVLRPNTTYYINVINRQYQSTGTTCSIAGCEALLTLSWPR